MKITRDLKAGTCTLVPVTRLEKKVIAEIASSSKEGDLLHYGGRKDEGDYCIIYLKRGALAFTLRGTSDEDKGMVGSLRNTCYFGSGGLIFLKKMLISGVLSIVLTAKRCKHCRAPMIRMIDCEWSTCDACAAKCKHDYIEGLVHGGYVGNMGVGYYCQKCGRGKPLTGNEPKMTRAEQDLEIEQKLGMTVIYKDVPATPGQIVALEKAAKAVALN